MNVKLASLCLKLWVLGLVGMSTAKVVFAQGPGSTGFDVGAFLWIVGGLTYALLGTLCILDRVSSEA